jgi:hypothetical protein
MKRSKAAAKHREDLRTVVFRGRDRPPEFARRPAAGVCSPPIKVVDPATQALIKAAIARQARRADSTP